jgi:GTPase
VNQSFQPEGVSASASGPERAVAVALQLEGQRREEVLEHLDELIRLADTAGAEVVDQVLQSRPRPDAASWVGKGKAEQIKAVVEELDADLVLVDDDLSPAQARNLGRIVGRRVLDRSGLILDIFARRARTREARTQVELAQLNYLLPRLAGAWTHLERQRGGIGLRGPGETQLETDRRLIRTRIRHLKLDLERIERGRDTRRGRRDELFRVALVGYTNAGKSTLLHRLTGADVLIEDRLFATLDATVRRLDLPDGTACLVADTVGFIRKLPHHLVASFRSTLEEAAGADLLLHVIDLADPHFEARMATVREVLADLGAGERPVIHVFNKVDRVDDPALLARAAREWEPAVLVSATQGVRLDALVEIVTRRRRPARLDFELLVPLERYDLVARARRELVVLSEASGEDGYCLRASCEPDRAQERLKPFLDAGCHLKLEDTVSP